MYLEKKFRRDGYTVCNLILYSIIANRKHAVLTYDDPETYKGAIVQGWPPSKNRSIPLYIKGM